MRMLAIFVSTLTLAASLGPAGAAPRPSGPHQHAARAGPDQPLTGMAPRAKHPRTRAAQHRRSQSTLDILRIASYRLHRCLQAPRRLSRALSKVEGEPSPI